MIEPSEEDILSGNIADLCESPICHRDDPFFNEIKQAFEIKKELKKIIDNIGDYNALSLFVAIKNISDKAEKK